MTTINDDFKKKVVIALLEARERWEGTDGAFAKSNGIPQTIYNRLKKGEIEGLIKPGKWLTLGRELGVTVVERKWNVARTDVFTTIEEDVLFCKKHSKSRVYVDECGIGKTFTAKYLSKTTKNIFYIDASQCKTKQAFIRELAKTLGVDFDGQYHYVKANIKYMLKILPQPIVIIDEAGDLEYNAFLELKEFWNATEGACGWYLMGADGLRYKIEKGISNKKVGYREMFSRFSENFTSAVPNGKQDRMAFYQKLISDVLAANMENKELMNFIVKKCITSNGDTGNIGGLRRAESLLILNQ